MNTIKRKEKFYVLCLCVLTLLSLLLRKNILYFVTLTLASSYIFFACKRIISTASVKLWCLSIALSAFLAFENLFSFNSNKAFFTAAFLWILINIFITYKILKLKR